LTALLQEYLARSAEHDPERVALVMDGERLTYGELDATSNRLARLLADAGCRRGDRVCLVLPKAPSAVLSMQAVLKADAAYVPIDISSPAPRVARIVQSAEPRIVLATPATAKLVDELVASSTLGSEVSIGYVEDGQGGERFEPKFRPADLASYSAEPVGFANQPEDLAHLLYTSGSTGLPKGVMITHAQVVHFIEWATGYFGMQAGDRNSGHAPLHFDLSTFDIYGTLAVGAELHPVPSSATLAPSGLAQWIRDAELTQWFSVPSVFSYMAKFDVLEQDDFPSLKRVIWCGEVLPTPILIHWMRRIPHASFTNLYGPTETTIASSYYEVRECPSDPSVPIPIGRPCAGEELAVLDDALQPVPAGETGEIFISGVGLSPGYWRDEERTAAAFVPHPQKPADRLYRTGDLGRRDEMGLFHYHGRTDSQIKSRGHRIELGEIETALNTLDSLREVAVVGSDSDSFEGTAICCAYVAAEPGGVAPHELRRRLSEVLPSYMLPSRWLALEVLPKNLNGKIDRPRLREFFKQQTGGGPGARLAVR
jgi:amino acid adenylation domain-containing protein